MYIRNVYFLIEMAFLFVSAIVFSVWCCRNSVNEYQKMLRNKNKEVKK